MSKTEVWLSRIVGTIIALMFLAGLIGTVQEARSHDVDERYDFPPDSMKVQLEIDATGDGIYEVRHVFYDTLAVWDRSTSGFMRVTYTQWDSLNNQYLKLTNTDYGHFWRDLMNSDLDSTGMVDLSDFAAFGKSYGNPKTITPDGLRMWDVWHINTDTGDTILDGYFYYYPAQRQ